MQKISRKLAAELGLKRYFTGKPCPHGHVCERQTSSCVCIECKLLHSKRWAKNNPEKVKSITGKYIDSEKGKAKRAQAMAEWMKENKEYHAAWRIKNRDKCRMASKSWRERNKESVLQSNRNRRAAKSNAEGSHSSKDVEQIYTKQKGKCASCLCNLNGEFHADHIMPLALGGSNWPENIQCLCPTCNVKKHAKDPLDWARQNGRLV